MRTQNESLPVHLIDADAERFVLACVLSGWQGYQQAHGQLDESDFASPDHRFVWRIANELADMGEEPSASGVMRITSERKHRGLTFDRILEITRFGGQGFRIEKWIQHLRRRALDREAYRLGELIQAHTAAGFGKNVEEVHAASERLAAIEARLYHVPPADGSIGQLIESSGGLDTIFSRPHGVVELPTPQWRAVMNGGLAPGTVTILAARTSVGKTALMLQVAMTAAESGKRTVLFSLEMQASELLRRMVSYRGGLDFGLLVQGGLSRKQRDRVRQITSEIENWPLSLYCDIHTLHGIEQAVEKAKPRFEFVAIDYLGLIEGRRAENRNVELAAISRRLKLAAMRGSGTPFLVLHQLNRQSESENRRPLLSDLRDSGAVEQDADNVVFLHQPRRSDWPKGHVELIVAKQRNGVRDIAIPMKFNGEVMRFSEVRP